MKKEEEFIIIQVRSFRNYYIFREKSSREIVALVSLFALLCIHKFDKTFVVLTCKQANDEAPSGKFSAELFLVLFTHFYFHQMRLCSE